MAEIGRLRGWLTYLAEEEGDVRSMAGAALAGVPAPERSSGPPPSIVGNADLSGVDILPGIVTFCPHMPTDFYVMTGAGLFKNGKPMTATEVSARQRVADHVPANWRDTVNACEIRAKDPDVACAAFDLTHFGSAAVNAGPQPADEAASPAARATEPVSDTQAARLQAMWDATADLSR